MITHIDHAKCARLLTQYQDNLPFSCVLPAIPLETESSYASGDKRSNVQRPLNNLLTRKFENRQNAPDGIYYFYPEVKLKINVSGYSRTL